jgi:lysozyme family protein
MTKAIQSVISEIALSLVSDGKPVFGITELQARLDGVPVEGIEVDPEDLQDLLGAELFEANGYDELPDEVQAQMVRNAYDLGETRANILLQAALTQVTSALHITGTLEKADFDFAHQIANEQPGLLSDCLTQRRTILMKRIEA